MLNESKYYKNGVLASSPATSTQNTSSSSSSVANSSLKANGNSMMIDTSKSHHLNLHTFTQYNQPIKNMSHLGNVNNNNVNHKNFNDYNNSSSINKDFYNSNSSSTNGSISSISNSKSNNAYSSSCNSTSSSTSSTGSVNVKFTGFFKDKIDEREKYLTAKYPNHQMALIKKRLKVEFWIDEQLKILFDISVRELKSFFCLIKTIKKGYGNELREQID